MMKKSFFALLSALALMLSNTAFAGNGGDAINWPLLWINLIGGTALFLYGMDVMSDAIKLAAGDGLRIFLGRMTTNRFLGAASGAVITGILNSSTVTTVLVVGFVSAGLMNLSQAISIIMGANIGSTFAAQIIAFKVTQYAIVPVAIGFVIHMRAKTPIGRQHGLIFIGLGLLFLGMAMMSNAMTPLRTYEPFHELMIRMEAPLLGILVGAVFTALVHSSAATTGIAIAMASSGLITLEAGIALALGANIGTCATALLASAGRSRESVRAALAHVLINVFGVIIWVGFIPEFADLVRSFSPTSDSVNEVDRMMAEVPRQLANAHTMFNVVNTLVLIGFSHYLAKLCVWLIPDAEESAVQPPLPSSSKYLDHELLETPTLALQRTRLQLKALKKAINQAYSRSYVTLFKDSEYPSEAREQAYAEELQKEIDATLSYLIAIPKESLTNKQSKRVLLYMASIRYLQNLNQNLQVRLDELREKAVAEKVEPSDKMMSLMKTLFELVWESTRESTKAITKNKAVLAEDCIQLEAKIDAQISQILQHQADQFLPDSQNRLTVFRVEMEFVEMMKQMYAESKQLAQLKLQMNPITPAHP